MPSIVPDLPNCVGNLPRRSPAEAVFSNQGVKSSLFATSKDCSNEANATSVYGGGSPCCSRAACHGAGDGGGTAAAGGESLLAGDGAGFCTATFVESSP